MKYIIDLRVTAKEIPAPGFARFWTEPLDTNFSSLPHPGQFAQLQTPRALLRRPISIHDVRDGRLAFLVQRVGEGTRWLTQLQVGDEMNAVLPLGHGFSVIQGLQGQSGPLLVGGGVGVAPLLYLGRCYYEAGIEPTFLLGARSADMLLCIRDFESLGRVLVTTEDGSRGVRGFVTQHPIVREESFSVVQTCGPTPMMKAVAALSHELGVRCEVSLENRMACGVGACLCCVQETIQGYQCVCTEGPVFDSEKLVLS